MFEVSKFTEDEKKQWHFLWSGYQKDEDASEERIEKEVEANWPRLQKDKTCHVNALRLTDTNEAVGFATFVTHWCTTSIKDECLLYDLFVMPKYQGQGGGRLLINSVLEFAKENNLEEVSWLTMDKNKQAQILYDKITDKVAWFRYKVKIS